MTIFKMLSKGFPFCIHTCNTQEAGCHWILTSLFFNVPNVQDEIRCHIDVLALLLLLLPMTLSVFPGLEISQDVCQNSWAWGGKESGVKAPREENVRCWLNDS